MLLNYNNLKGFIKVKALNRRQAIWAVVLVAYNFIIKYRVGKINPVNTLLRRPLGVGGPLEENTMLLLL